MLMLLKSSIETIEIVNFECAIICMMLSPIFKFGDSLKIDEYCQNKSLFLGEMKKLIHYTSRAII